MSVFRRVQWKIIQAIARRLPPCRSITHLLTESRDRKLTFTEYITLRAHLLVCTWCTRYGHQITSLDKALEVAGNQPERLVGVQSTLSNSARERILKSLQQGH